MLKEHDPEVTPSKKAPYIDDDSTLSRQRKRKKETTEMKLDKKTTVENFTKKFDATGEGLKIPVVEKARTSMTSHGLRYILALMTSWVTNCYVATRNHRWKQMR